MKRFQRLLSCVVVFVLLATSLASTAFAANATKKQTTRAIGIVFDNSGSMYLGNNTAWCRATYAMEVFASMLNEGDTLYIYPMSPIRVGGTEYDSEWNPLEVSGGSDTSVIEDIVTISAQNTPIETITHAYNGLAGANADEKWLIVLTDGDLFYENDDPLEDSAGRMDEVLSGFGSGVNLMYLGIGSNPVMPTAGGVTAMQASNSGDILNKLTSMCNTIFGRDELQVGGSTVEFDVSMSKLIVFVQGSDISSIEVTDASGASVGTPDSVYTPRYSESGCERIPTINGDLMVGQNYTLSYDSNLSGCIAAFSDLDAGSYSIQFSGSADSICVYYEPDVDVVATLVDAEGNPVDTEGDLLPGEYYIQYGLADKNGDMTDSSLLGERNFEITYTLNGEPVTETGTQNGRIPVTVEAGDQLDLEEIDATYLSGYNIKKSGPELGWPDLGFQFGFPETGQLSLEVSGGADTIGVSEIDGTSYRVEVCYDGRKLTAEELQAVDFEAAVSPDSLTASVSRDGDAYVVELGYANGAAGVTEDAFTVAMTADYVDEYGRTVSAEASVSAALEDDGHALRVQLEKQEYYTKLNLSKSGPVLARLTLDGEPLTGEQMAALEFTVECEGLNYTVTPVPEESLYEISLAEGNEDAATGGYPLRAAARYVDEVGREAAAEDSTTVRIHLLPFWVWIVLALLVLAIIALILWIYFNQKVLPKNIVVDAQSLDFTVGNDNVAGLARVKFEGGNQARGKLTISSPSYDLMPLASCTVTMELEAVSPRRKASKDRAAKVVKIIFSPHDDPNDTLDIMPVSFVYRNGTLVNAALADDDDLGGMAPPAAAAKGGRQGKDRPALAELRNGTNCAYAGSFFVSPKRRRRMDLSFRLSFTDKANMTHKGKKAGKGH